MITPLAYADSLRIGSVDFVSPDEIKVLLDIEAPGDIALNTGVPRPFPRINNYVLLPSENGFLVAQIEWITIESSQYPKRKGMQDFGVVDLPFPLRKMSLNPLGVLTEKHTEANTSVYSFSRGILIYPTVGDPVILPSQEQLRAIVESGENRRVKIGLSPLAGNAEVSIDPDRLFGRHLAILGNTGSGKSCSVAGIIRWSIEAAQREKGDDAKINSRFIVLDPNGEYSKAFNGLENVHRFTVETNGQSDAKHLHVPIWFWNSSEWISFTQASAKTQRPLLRRALRDIKQGSKFEQNSEEAKTLELRRYLSYQFIKIRRDISNNVIKEEESKFGFYLKSVADDLSSKISLYSEFKVEIQNIIVLINNLLKDTYNTFNKNGKTIEYYRAFQDDAVESIKDLINNLINSMGGLIYQDKNVSEDIPLPFKVEEFADYIQMLGIEEKSSQFVDFLVMRIRALISDKKISEISLPSDMTLEKWLNEYICDSNSLKGSITVIDLSLVPAEVIHIITAVIARMTLEALQRYRRLNKGVTLPTTIVMEEAHTFIKRYQNETDELSSATVCTQAFEKIAREGRKFGLGLVLSSQRPSELSPTVLSQCNTFLLHRISNDRDQELVHKLVPDNLHGLLRELPSLPSRRAILLGWASELPVMVEMNFLNEEHRPQSNDPDYWETWTAKGDKKRLVNWKEIADDWQQTGIIATEIDKEENPPEAPHEQPPL
jgi:DNA helicase HerA-like ATPase